MNNQNIDITFHVTMISLENNENPTLEDGECYLIIYNDTVAIGAWHKDICAFIGPDGEFIKEKNVTAFQDISKIRFNICY